MRFADLFLKNMMLRRNGKIDIFSGEYYNIFGLYFAGANSKTRKETASNAA